MEQWLFPLAWELSSVLYLCSKFLVDQKLYLDLGIENLPVPPVILDLALTQHS